MKPGCGCLVLILGAINLIFFIMAIWGAATEGEVLTALVGLLFLANAGILAGVGWASIRGGGLRLPTSLTGERE